MHKWNPIFVNNKLKGYRKVASSQGCQFITSKLPYNFSLKQFFPFRLSSGLALGAKEKGSFKPLKGVLHLWALFLKTLCIFSKNKATSEKVSYGSGQKCSKELENYSFTSVETIVVKLQWKMCKNQYFPCFEP